jgi:hypothetical protein
MENPSPSSALGPLKYTKPPQRRRLSLFLSLGLNVGLLVFLAIIYRPSPSKPGTEVLQALEKNANPKVHCEIVKQRITTPWSKWESSDLSAYAANLRATGCPQKTIRDILLPLIEETFARTDSSAFEPTNFWASFSERQSAAASRAERERALENEKSKMLQDVLGFTWTSKGLTELSRPATMRIFGFIDYDRAEKLVCIDDRIESDLSRSDFASLADNWGAIDHAWRQAASSLLSPAELEELGVRGQVLMAQRRNGSLCVADLSGPELRQLMAFRRECCIPSSLAWITGMELPLPDPDWPSEQKFNGRARSLLGDTRFLEYLKCGDTSIGRTLVAVEKERLPRSLALQLYDLRQAAAERAQEIRGLPVSRSEKRAQLAALRQSAFEQLAALPNAAAEGLLVRINEDWLQEVAKP